MGHYGATTLLTCDLPCQLPSREFCNKAKHWQWLSLSISVAGCVFVACLWTAKTETTIFVAQNTATSTSALQAQTSLGKHQPVQTNKRMVVKAKDVTLIDLGTAIVHHGKYDATPLQRSPREMQPPWGNWILGTIGMFMSAVAAVSLWQKPRPSETFSLVAFAANEGGKREQGRREQGRRKKAKDSMDDGTSDVGTAIGAASGPAVGLVDSPATSPAAGPANSPVLGSAGGPAAGPPVVPAVGLRDQPTAGPTIVPTVGSSTRLAASSTDGLAGGAESEGHDSLEGQEPDVAPEPRSPRDGGDRLQRLKELAWTKEVKDDITYAEFAMAVNPTAPMPSSPLSPERPVNGIDYFKIADKLDSNLERMQRKGRWTLNPDDIESLMERLRATKESIDQFMAKTYKANLADEKEVGTSAQSSKARVAEAKDDAEDKKGLPLRLELFVREDGTVDWDGAIESGRELAVFGKEVWERLNGRAIEENEEAKNSRTTFSSIDENPSIVALKAKVEALESSLAEARALRDRTQESVWTMRAMGEPISSQVRLEMKAAAQNVLELRRKLAVQQLDLDMERICLYLEQEIDQSSSVQDQKMLVAEFGLLEKQLQMLLSILGDWEGPGISDDVDESELQLLEKEISDLKVRLGFDMQGTTIDWGKSLRDFWEESSNKFREGVAFYVKGTRMLFSDIMYALWLFRRTLEGYTLKPREVRTIRRTVKDVLTFIPALIILIIPLSPVGHVLVFSFIQRFFPDFFPTAFSDRRQNLLKMYEEIERKPSEEVSTSQSKA